MVSRINEIAPWEADPARVSPRGRYPFPGAAFEASSRRNLHPLMAKFRWTARDAPGGAGRKGG